MLLNETEIRKQVQIDNSHADGYRAAGYDLRIGKIVSGKKKFRPFSLRSSYELKPGAVVEVISAETVTLSADVAGYAMVKTSLCNDGLLALNIGIIDPFYSGPLSTTLLNFSGTTRWLNVGDVFLRLTFHQCHAADPKRKPPPEDPQKYEKIHRRKAAEMGETFLHLDKTTDAAIRASFVRYGFIFAFALALLTFGVNFGLAWASYYLWRKDPFLGDMLRRVSIDKQEAEKSAQLLQDQESRRADEQQKVIDDLRRRIDELEKATRDRSVPVKP